MACRKERQKRDLLRIVRTPDRRVLLDASGRLAGRGAYLCADRSCWSLALKKSALERALDVQLPAELRSRLESPDPALFSGGTHGA